MLTSAFNQFINPWAIAAIGWWYYIAYCAWLVIELIFVLVYVVETKGMLWHDGFDIYKIGLNENLQVAHWRKRQQCSMKMNNITIYWQWEEK